MNNLHEAVKGYIEEIKSIRTYNTPPHISIRCKTKVIEQELNIQISKQTNKFHIWRYSFIKIEIFHISIKHNLNQIGRPCTRSSFMLILISHSSFLMG